MNQVTWGVPYDLKIKYLRMKRYIKAIAYVSVLFVLAACNNQDWEFDDFDYTTAYFPYQSPVRTIVLDEYYAINQNSSDLDKKFTISVTIGGVYENKKNINVNWELDESLANGIVNTISGEKMQVMPRSYYNFVTTGNTVVIPAGKLSGGIQVQLTDEFLNDSSAAFTKYIIPIKITTSETDSVLSGKPAVNTPDKRNPLDWEIQPKDFTLFAVKYVNKFHGTFLLRGKSVISNTATSSIMEEVKYRQPYVERDEVVQLVTSFKNAVLYKNSVRASSGSPGKFEVEISFDNDENGTIKSTKKSDFPVTGTASFKPEGDEWGGKKRNVVYLNYQITVGAQTHQVNDTLVYRDKNVKFEEFKPGVE